MIRVLFIGQQPETVDFTESVLPPDMNAERIHAGIGVALKRWANADGRSICACFSPMKQPDPRACEGIGAQPRLGPDPSTSLRMR